MPNKPVITSLEVKNDVKHPNKNQAQQTIATHATLTFSYLMLLIGSAVITTLGLLINQPAVVIGGMIVAPIMWPMVRIALGISSSNSKHISEGIVLLIISIVLTFLAASLIAFISPIKSLNAEIIARTQPTLLDLIIALTAGTIGALAITHPRVSPNLAGVAVATSLLPPLCVSGIGFSLLNWEVSLGSFILFVANMVAVLFTALLIFIIAGLQKKSKHSTTKAGISTTATLLILIAIPLGIFLQRQSFEIRSSSKIFSALQSQLYEISPQITIDDLQVELIHNGSIVSVSARIWVPVDTTIDIEQKQKLTQSLSELIDKPIELQLRLQPTIKTRTQSDSELQLVEAQITDLLISIIKNEYRDTTIDSLKTNLQENTVFVDLVIRSHPNTLFTDSDRLRYEKVLSEATGKNVEMNIEIIPRIQLVSDTTKQHREIEYVVREYFAKYIPETTITSISINSTNPENSTLVDNTTITMTVVSPRNSTIKTELLRELKDQLQKTFDRDITLEIGASSATLLSL